MALFRWEHGKRDVVGDVRRELDFHLEERTRDLQASGVAPEDAARQARAEFGDRDAIEGEVRRLRADTVQRRGRRNWLADCLHDLRMARRSLLRTPGFTLVAVLTLGLGIGANSAVFSIVRSVLLRPLPYPHADELVQLWTDTRARNGRTAPEWLTPPDFADWREQNRSFRAMTAYQAWQPVLTEAGEPANLLGLMVTGDFSDVLGVKPAIGRSLAAPDDDAGAERVVLLSDALWRGRFGGDPAVINRTIQLDGTPWRVVGVMPSSFRPPVPFTVSLIRPMRRPASSGCGRGCIVLRAIGRLRLGTSVAAAQADLGIVAAGLADRFPATNAGVTPRLVPLHDQVTGPTRTALLMLTGAVALVLLIACVNIANLLLVRGATRATELGVRAALGAGRGRIVRQLLAESAALALAGGAAAIVIAAVGARLLGAVVPPDIRAIQPIHVDAAVIGYTALITLLAGMLFGLLPAVRAARSDLMAALRATVRDSGSGGALRHLLATSQLALAVMLLVGAGLLMRSLVRLQRVDLGYRTDGVLMETVNLPAPHYDDAGAVRAATALLTRLRNDPGVAAAEITDDPPLGAGDQDVDVTAVGMTVDSKGSGGIWYRSVSPGYLALMRMRITAGRTFASTDDANAPRAGIVNVAAARRYWHGENPVGRVLRVGSQPGTMITIVGVVADDRQDGPNQPVKAELFVPFDQQPDRGFTLVVEPRQGEVLAAAAIRRALREVDPLLPFEPPTAIAATVRDVTAAPRLYAILLGVFAATALLLAILGVYGVMAFVVRQRQREIGVRIALGATPASIYRMILLRGAKLTAGGTLLGLLGAAALTRFLQALLFGTAPLDLTTFVAVPIVLGLTAFVACWLPARRAVRIDPLTTMRN